MTMTRFETIGLITGMHRSGTTWLGSACAKLDDTVVMHEPLNYTSGIVGVPHWYPDPKQDDIREQLRAVITQVISGRARFRLRRSDDSLVKALARIITLGGPDYWAYKKKMKSAARHLILKDPFAIRMCLWLSEEFSIRTVVLVRHPCSLYLSLKRMHWQTPNITPQGIYTGAPADISTDPIERAREFGYFWGRIYDSVSEQTKANKGAIEVLRHEDLSLKPVVTAQVAFAHLGLKMNKEASDFLVSSTSGDVIEPPEKLLHSMNRDSAKLVHAWRNRMDQTEADAIINAAGQSFLSLYPETEHSYG